MPGRWLTTGLLLALAGCQFDPGGVRAGPADPIAFVDGAAAAPIDATPAPDAAPPDAEIGCRDRDGDGVSVGVGGAECGVTDCDDGDERVFPGQEEAFTTTTSTGGFDFDCDGQETMIAAYQGVDCFWDWGECRGSGWTSAMPACGQPGVWHWCEADGFNCVETSEFDAAMPCR